MTTERVCTAWRCEQSCWGLPGCQHPERTPFYQIELGVELCSHWQPILAAFEISAAVFILIGWLTS